MKYRGKARILGNNIDTDMIISGQHLSSTDPDYLAKHCFETLAEEWAKKICRGDILVAGGNFGCGSSREHAPMALKAAGISCLIAESYGAIFYRNAINIGLPALEFKTNIGRFKEGDIIEVDIKIGSIKNETTEKVYHSSQKLTPMVLDILKSGGLLSYISKMPMAK
jgi:3-isopropylmalate/(R)-2-methylmalate dehydratase small subunit